MTRRSFFSGLLGLAGLAAVAPKIAKAVPKPNGDFETWGNTARIPANWTIVVPSRNVIASRIIDGGRRPEET